MSHPTMGAWIEIYYIAIQIMQVLRSHPTMGAWIEIIGLFAFSSSKISRTLSIIPASASHPTMGAWIEIFPNLQPICRIYVAPHDGCVD